MSFEPILLDYGTSPYSQKVHLFCAAANITIKSCEQPPLLPRPILENIGVTYRRIPILAIGKDLFADSSLILDTLQNSFGSKLVTGPADKAYETFGNSLFSLGLRIISVKTLPPIFVKDRATIFEELIRPNHDDNRPSAIAELRASLAIVERKFLGSGKQFIGGNQISMSDIHVAWVVNWLLNGSFGMGKQPGFGRDDFPKISAWLDIMPHQEAEKLSGEEAVKAILSAQYFVKETEAISSDPLGLSIGDDVCAETTDAVPGAHPQHGKLVGLTIDTVTLQLKNEIRIHFPRRGTIISKA